LLGKLARPPEFFPKGYSRLLPNIMMISNIRENGQTIGALPDGEMMFHHDMLHAEIPHNATLLYSMEVPTYGGDTLFASGYAAYESLDPAIRTKLAGRNAIHHYNYGSTQRGDDRGVAAYGESVHPIFRTHDETGRKAIYVNRLMTVGIVDMPQEESDPLLHAIFDHSERPEFVYTHAWQVGDLLVWDNRCSMHARTDFLDQRRLMLRTTARGTERPWRSRSRRRHPDEPIVGTALRNVRLMAQRSAICRCTADRCRNGWRPWARLGAVMTEAVVHHYGRDEFAPTGKSVWLSVLRRAWDGLHSSGLRRASSARSSAG
jgi:taurine dioxygenase